ncbi:MAG TPA: tetratricopeptide repeat protein [Dissulfurispiraceae bacterium]
MESQEAEKLFTKGVNAFSRGRTLSALAFFEKAINIESTPVCHSYLAVCIAKERGQVRKAISLCKEIIDKDPGNPVHYLNLGRIYLLAGDKTEASKAFRDGLTYGEDPQIIDELDKLVIRKPPVFPFLKRENFINKYAGLVLSTLRLR